MENIEDQNLFAGWVEHRYCCDGRLTKIIFWTKKRQYHHAWIPAMIGEHVGSNHYKYEICDTFVTKYGMLAAVNRGLRFETRHEVFSWLNQIMVQVPGERWDYFTTIIQQNDEAQITGEPLPQKLIGCCKRGGNQMLIESGTRIYSVALNAENKSEAWDTFLQDHKIKNGYTIVFIKCGRNAYEAIVYGPRNCYKNFEWKQRNEYTFGLARAYRIEYDLIDP